MTPARNDKPTVRRVHSRFDGALTVEIAEDMLVMRPKGARKGGPAEVFVPWGLVYQIAMDPEGVARPRRRGRRGER